MTTYPAPSDPRRSPDFVLRSPDAVLAALPYLLGFMPSSSAVLLWLRSGRILLTQRLDLPDSPSEAPAWLEAVFGHGAAARTEEIILVLVTDRPDAGAIAAPVLAEADARGIDVRDVLHLAGERWTSLLCDDAGCCGPDGRLVQQGTRDMVAAEFALLGVAPLADRQALVSEFAADPDGLRSVAPLLDQRMADRARRLAAGGEARETWRDEACGSVLEALGGPRGRRTPAPAEEAEWAAAIACSLMDVRVRDTVLWELTRRSRQLLQQALATLTRAMVATPPGHVAPVATTCALVAWLLGDGARASIATERALADDPGYSLATLIAASLQAGLPPEAWREATAGLSREECRYGADGAGRRRRRAS